MAEPTLNERFFDALISGHRAGARRAVDECIEAGYSGEAILEQLFFPTLEMVQNLYRNDQLTTLAHHYATRLLRMLTDQMQLRLQPGSPNGKRVLLICGPYEPDELAGQMAADLLEAAGYETYFPGGGVANDEIIQQLGQLEPDALVFYGTHPQDLPYIRQLIDYLHEVGKCPNLQIVVGGGVFNRADGLAEEIGADLWAKTPHELVENMDAEPQRRMPNDQRTVGRKRRAGGNGKAGRQTEAA